MKTILTIIAVCIVLAVNGQKTPHQQQNEGMGLHPIGEENQVMYHWKDILGNNHQRLFKFGQRLIQDDEPKNIWVIYEICKEGAWMSCKSNNGDGYSAFEYLVENSYEAGKKPKSHTKFKKPINKTRTTEFAWYDSSESFTGNNFVNDTTYTVVHYASLKPDDIISIPVKDTAEQHRLIHAMPELIPFETIVDTVKWPYASYYDYMINLRDTTNPFKSFRNAWLKYHSGKWYSNWPYVFEMDYNRTHIKVYKLEEVYNWDVK